MELELPFFKAHPGETVIISYQGEAHLGIPESVYTDLEEKLNNTEDQKSRKKRFFFIAVECMQNIIRHQENSGFKIDFPVKVTAFAHPGNHYRIVTGNVLNSSNAQTLKKQLEELLKLSGTELHEQYLQKLSETTISEKGGAGLGLIEIARKSENNIQYNFNDDGSNAFFSLEVTVK